MSLKNRPHETAKRYTELLPAQFAMFADGHRETMQTVMWLVGLAAACLTLLASRDSWFSRDQHLREWLASGLFFTVLLGVLQRFAHWWTLNRERLALMHLQHALASFTAERATPLERQPYWDRNELLRQLELEFELSPKLTFLSGMTDEQLVEIYDHLVASHQEFSSAGDETLRKMFRAVEGKPIDFKEPSINAKDQFVTLRRVGASLEYWDRIATILFVLLGITFMSTLGVLLVIAYSV